MFKHYRELKRGEQIVVGVDTSAGGLDYTAAQFLSKTHIDVPIVYHSKKTATELTNSLPHMLEVIHDTTGIAPTIAYERANGGQFEMDRLAVLNRFGKFRLYMMLNAGRIDAPDPVRYGWDTNSATRPKMLQDLKDAIDKRLLKIYDKQTISELYSFIVVQTSSSWKAQAERHSHDDLVMALAIAYQLFIDVPTMYVEDYFSPPPKFEPMDKIIGI